MSNLSYCSAANVSIILMFLPSIRPKSSNPLRSASTRPISPSAFSACQRTPTTGIFFDCWARATIGHVAAAAALPTPTINSRRLISAAGSLDQHCRVKLKLNSQTFQDRNSIKSLCRTWQKISPALRNRGMSPWVRSGITRIEYILSEPTPKADPRFRQAPATQEGLCRGGDRLARRHSHRNRRLRKTLPRVPLGHPGAVQHRDRLLRSPCRWLQPPGGDLCRRRRRGDANFI